MKASQGDGRTHIEDALGRGAVAVLSSEPIQEENVTNLVAAHPRLALAKAASVFYDPADQKMKMIGVTGTNGKTTTVEWLRTSSR